MIRPLTVLALSLSLVACGPDAPQVDLPAENTTNNDSLEEGTLFKDDIAAYKTVVNVIRETGLAQNFVILPGDVKQVVAAIENDERILKYNPDFMKTIESDTTWYGISVLASQIGHHLSNHELADGKANLEEELEADKYAGFVLHKMGASLEEAIAAMERAAKEGENDHQASVNARIASLTQGWTNAKALSSDTSVTAIADTPKTAIQPTELTNKEQSEKPAYVYQIFLALDTSFYYIDEQNVAYAENGTKYQKIGERKSSNKPGFDWIFTKGEDSYGVGADGRLWAFSADGHFHIVGQAVKLEE